MKKLFAVFLSVLLLMTCVPLGAVSVSAATYGVLTYKISDGEVTITGYTDDLPTDLVIPDTIEGYPVTAIGEYAFEWCTSLTSVTIPDSVTTIGDSAFEDCSSLTSVTIGNGVTSIGGSVFWECVALSSINIPDSVTCIGNYAFYGTAYYNDESNWGNDVLYIGRHLIKAKSTLSGRYDIKNDTLTIAGSAFNKCAALTEVIIPNSVMFIGNDAFTYCTALTEVIIPDSVISIGDYAFTRCKSLTSIAIPHSVTSIGRGTFEYCIALSSITIPDSITLIDRWAFDECDSLTDVYYTGSETDRGNIAIDDSNNELLNATWHYNYAPVISGDANGDGSVNARDAALLQQYIAGWDATLDEASADANGDGSVNARDVALLQQYIAGWDVQLGK